MKTDLFQPHGHCWVFQICWHTECSTLTASSFRIWNSLAGIPSPPLAFFVLQPNKNKGSFICVKWLKLHKCYNNTAVYLEGDLGYASWSGIRTAIACEVRDLKYDRKYQIWMIRMGVAHYTQWTEEAGRYLSVGTLCISGLVGSIGCSFLDSSSFSCVLNDT